MSGLVVDVCTHPQACRGEFSNYIFEKTEGLIKKAQA